MASDKVNFSSNDILEKEFTIKPKGYDAEQVDEFLDQVIEDYKMFENLENQLKTEVKTNSFLRKQLGDLELENEILNKKLGEYRYTASKGDFGNIELLKKISELEQEVFELKKNQNSGQPE